MEGGSPSTFFCGSTSVGIVSLSVLIFQIQYIHLLALNTRNVCVRQHVGLCDESEHRISTLLGSVGHLLQKQSTYNRRCLSLLADNKVIATTQHVIKLSVAQHATQG